MLRNAKLLRLSFCFSFSWFVCVLNREICYFNAFGSRSRNLTALLRAPRWIKGEGQEEQSEREAWEGRREREVKVCTHCEILCTVLDSFFQISK